MSCPRCDGDNLAAIMESDDGEQLCIECALCGYSWWADADDVDLDDGLDSYLDDGPGWSDP